MPFEEQLDIYLRARFTLIVVITQEEGRVVESVKKVCENSSRQCFEWDYADGFSGQGSIKDPISVLDTIDKAQNDGVYVLKDLHEFWNQTTVKRKLKNLSERLKYTRKSLIVTTPILKLPDELKDGSVVIELSMPTAEELKDELDELTTKAGIKTKITEATKQRIIQAAMGMTLNQAQRAFSKAIVSLGGLDERAIELITKEKKQVVRENRALEFYDVTETPDYVGGLEVLKEWLRQREQALGDEAKAYGLPDPKGILLMGIPGTGKSLTAKMVAGLWRMPLLRLDVGAIFGSLVGESERQARESLRIAETVAPCILWIDEIEKSFSFGGLDGGTSQRVFATILTWMQERRAPVFVVATANDINLLPPELLRAGRFDACFFLDLPTPEERREIFSIHLKKRNRLPAMFDLDRLVKESEGYVGSEIEQAIIDAMYRAFSENKREFNTEDIIQALKGQVPLSQSQKESVEIMRRWLVEGRVKSASFKEVNQAKESFVSIPLELKQ